MSAFIKKFPFKFFAFAFFCQGFLSSFERFYPVVNCNGVLGFFVLIILGVLHVKNLVALIVEGGYAFIMY